VQIAVPDLEARLAFEAEKRTTQAESPRGAAQPLIEPLSHRELEVLRLITQRPSNHEIGEPLVLALDTIGRSSGNSRSSTEAFARARELGLS